jgi:hypothetical protein
MSDDCVAPQVALVAVGNIANDNHALVPFTAEKEAIADLMADRRVGHAAGQLGKQLAGQFASAGLVGWAVLPDRVTTNISCGFNRCLQVRLSGSHALFGSHAVQAPASPHAVSLVPSWQMPSASQQPVGHARGLQGGSAGHPLSTANPITSQRREGMGFQ